MNNGHLKDCVFMSKLIEQTEKGLNNLKKIQQIYLSKPSKDAVYKNDGHYHFYIGLYRDGSGDGADLARYYGNEELLVVIIKMLEKQLITYKAEFEGM